MVMASFQKQPSFGDLVQKFSQVRILGSGGVKVYDVATPDEVAVDRKGVEDEEYFHEAESDSLDERDELSQKVQDLENLIADAFVTISALKAAYIELQAAHAPYDPEKLQLADKAVILQFKKLSDWKRLFREKQKLAFSGVSLSRTPKSSLEDGVEDMVKKVQELQSTLFQKEKMLETCTMHIKSYQRELEEKSAEIENLQNSLGKVSAKRDKLERHFRRLCRSAKSSNGLVSELSAIPRLFELVVEEAKEAASSFAGLLITSMQSAQWDLDAAASSIEPGIIYASPDHKRFAFESYVCHRMFSGFENENFYINGSLSSIMDPEKHRHECLLQFEDMRSMDPLELVSITPDCLFGRFCHRKYLHLVHEKMEECFFGHSQHRAQLLKGEHPRSRFYQSFLKFAKAVWLVHRLAFSFSPAVNIFQVRRNSEFHPDYMESVVQKIKMRDDNSNSHPKVGLTVTPGFCVGKAVLKCQVYLDDMVATE